MSIQTNNKDATGVLAGCDGRLLLRVIIYLYSHIIEIKNNSIHIL